jgi:hypothetical protein
MQANAAAACRTGIVITPVKNGHELGQRQNRSCPFL